MAKVIMKKTVYDGKIYHKAGETVEISDEKLKFYLERGYAYKVEVPKAIERSEPETKEEIPAETKEEKIVYKKKKK